MKSATAFLALLCGSATVAGQPHIDCSVSACGATNASATSLHVDATIGQPLIGLTGVGNMMIEQGFWFVGPECLTSVSAIEMPWITHLLTIRHYPNPVVDEIDIMVALRESAHCAIALYDILGNRLRNLAEGTFPDGEHHLRMALSDLSPGVYRLVLHTQKETATSMMVVRR